MTIVNKAFIQFDSTKVKKNLIDLCEQIINFDIKYITKKTKEELIDKINQEFDDHERKFQLEPETQNEWKTLRDEYNDALKEKDYRFKKITGANDIVNRVILKNQVNPSNDELSKEVESLEKRKETYKALLDSCDEMLKRSLTKLSEEVRAQEKKFSEDVDLMSRNFNAVIPNKIECPLQEEIQRTGDANKILIDFNNKCDLLEKEEKSVSKGYELFVEVFKRQLPVNLTLQDAKEQIKQLKKIWEIKSKMNEIVKGWRETQFYNFDLPKMEKDRAEIYQNLITNCVGNLKSTPIYATMEEQLKLYQKLIDVLVLLRDDAMCENLESHWEKVAELLGKNSIEPKATDFNFERILDYKFEQNREGISNIVEDAKKQQNLDRGLEAIKEDWKKKELKFDFRETVKEKEKDAEFKLTAANKVWVDALEAHLAKIAEYKSTPFYEDFKTKIDELETDLNKFSDIYQILKQVQDKRNYLKNIFSKDLDDNYQQSGTVLVTYKRNNVIFIDICAEFSKKKYVKECFLQPGLEEALSNLLYQFSDVERSMNS